MKHGILLAIPLLTACSSSLTGNLGNLKFHYLTDDEVADFNKPVAVGGFLDLWVTEVGTNAPVDITSAEFDDPSVLDVVRFSGDDITITGVGDGSALLSVEAVNADGETLPDEVNMLAATPEVLTLSHTCETGSRAAYITDREISIGFELSRENGQPVIGYGYYPVEISGGEVTLLSDKSNQTWMQIDTGPVAASATIASTIDDTSLTLEVITPGDVNGVQEPIPWVNEDIDVGDTEYFFVRPLYGGIAVCQSNLEKTVQSDTPDICTLEDTDVATDDGAESLETGWFTITGVSAGTCLYTVTYTEGNQGAGASAQFQFEIQP